MVSKDDRTDAQRMTHTIGIAGTDRFLSGWGGAAGGASVACWACLPDHESHVREWVESRKDMKRVRSIDLRYWRPKAAHVHVYVVDESHPAWPHWAKKAN